MNSQFNKGQAIRINAYGGKTPVVTVVEDRGDVVMICKPAEFQQAAQERREPVSIGCHKAHVLVEVPASA